MTFVPHDNAITRRPFRVVPSTTRGQSVTRSCCCLDSMSPHSIHTDYSLLGRRQKTSALENGEKKSTFIGPNTEEKRILILCDSFDPLLSFLTVY